MKDIWKTFNEVNDFHLLNFCTMKYLALNEKPLCVTHCFSTVFFPRGKMKYKKTVILFKNLFKTFFVKKTIFNYLSFMLVIVFKERIQKVENFQVCSLCNRGEPPRSVLRLRFKNRESPGEYA